MALTDDNGVNATMLMQPAYGTPYGGGYGGGGLFGGGNSDLLGLLFVIALCNGGFGGFGFGGGYGAMLGMGGMWGMDMLYPWLNNSQNINDGFRDQQLATQVNGIQNAITSGFGDVQLGIAGVNQNICQTGNGIQNAINQGFANTNLGMCQGFNGVNNSIFGAQTAISQQMNANEMASLNRSFAEQAANSQGFNNVQAQLAQNGYNQAAGLADVKFTLATEACNTRTTDTANTQAVLNAINNGIQSIKDDLCADRLAASQRETEAERRENANLRSQLNMTQLAASQAAQNTFISQGFANEVDALYNRLKSCPVNTVPVYGNQPIFTCSQNVANSNFGCGCNGNNF